MNRPDRIQYRERMFFRSCLESAPKGVPPGRISLPVESGGNGQTHPQLYQLKRNLLHAALEKTTNTVVLFKQIYGAANQAAELAWTTTYPCLVFPCLFEEMAQVVRTRFQQEQLQCSDAKSLPALSGIDPGFDGVRPDSGPSNPISRTETLRVLFTLPETR
jgi:hypothetical protein